MQYYLRCIDHPEYANPDPSKLDFEKEEYDGDCREFYNYQWFVSFMLLACDQVIRLRGGGPDWEKFVKNNVGYHRDYLKSSAFNETYHRFSPELISKVDQILEEKQTGEGA
jgi:hypothetical protein